MNMPWQREIGMNSTCSVCVNMFNLVSMLQPVMIKHVCNDNQRLQFLMPCISSQEWIMIYLGYQHRVKMIVMQYDDMVSSSECSSGQTWYMFMHVVESKPTQPLYCLCSRCSYPTHASVQCYLCIMPCYDRCCSLAVRFPILNCQPSPVLSGNSACTSKP